MCGFKGLNNCFWLLLILGGAVLYLRYIEKRSLFYPTREMEYSPKEIGLAFEEVTFKTKDNLNIYGWFLPCREAEWTVLFCHGNAGNISHRLQKLKFFYDLGCNVFIFDYRGYGRSEGMPSEKGLYIDAQAAYDYLLSRRLKAGQIVGFGESLGGAVIVDLAYASRLAGLILEGTFSNAKDMVRIIYPFLPFWIFASRLDSLSKIKSITSPKLLVHSINDEIVPYKLGKKLYLAAAEPKEFLEMRGGHNSCFFESEDILKRKIADFLSRLEK